MTASPILSANMKLGLVLAGYLAIAMAAWFGLSDAGRYDEVSDHPFAFWVELLFKLIAFLTLTAFSFAYAAAVTDSDPRAPKGGLGLPGALPVWLLALMLAGLVLAGVLGLALAICVAVGVLAGSKAGHWAGGRLLETRDDCPGRRERWAVVLAGYLAAAPTTLVAFTVVLVLLRQG